MTFDERLAKLGVELRDLDSIHFFRRGMSIYERFIDIAEEKAKKIDGDVGTTLAMVLIDAINERDDIIDRMETRIVNLTGEIVYLMERLADCGGLDCSDCIHCDEEEDGCTLCDDGEKHGEWCGIPEDWED